MKKSIYYVYAKGAFNLWALIYQTENQTEAANIASQYNKAKVLKTKMSN
jgi:hypothetical protein